MPELLASFRGAVTCSVARDVLGLTLRGDTAQAPGEPTALAFSAAAPADFPAQLTDALVERLEGGEYRIRSGGREWLISAPVHLHREIAARFYRAIPPRPAPLARRVFFRIALALAASRGGLALLRVLRR
ncbi:MAG TPA: hypothetical protein VIH60_06380 [Steroidobacteraceae bacterium]|jgi:hypothetical protein